MAPYYGLGLIGDSSHWDWLFLLLGDGSAAMRILGIDPGYATIGFGLVEAVGASVRMLNYGVITTSPESSFPARLNVIFQDMKELLETTKPDAVSIEELFFGRNITTGIDVAHGRGVIVLAIEQYGIPLYEYTPMQVKQSVVGYGKATKLQVMDMTRRILHLDKIPRPDDAADALAMAICHARAATSLLMKSEN